MFEEDKRENLRICLAMAPRYCGECGDFHLSVAVRRSEIGPKKYGIDFDRQDFVELLAEGLTLRQRSHAPLTVLIAGAADTAILKLTLDAAMQVGGEPFARQLATTVVDLCETPLEMCRTFAARHDLNVATRRADIGSFVPGRRYGVIAMHGVLPFFPAGRRLEYMQRIVSWLDPQGLVVSSSQIAESSRTVGVADEISGRRASLEEFLATEGQDIAVNRQDLFARLERAAVIRNGYSRVFDDEAALQKFYSEAGLSLLNRHVVAVDGASAYKRYKQRAVVLGQAD
jgi:hypothetical protein